MLKHKTPLQAKNSSSTRELTGSIPIKSVLFIMILINRAALSVSWAKWGEKFFALPAQDCFTPVLKNLSTPLYVTEF